MTKPIQHSFIVDYPFDAGLVPPTHHTVKVRVVESRYEVVAPMSVSGFMDVKLALLDGGIPNKPGLESLWIAVRHNSVSSKLCSVGSELTLQFDQAGQSVVIREIADAMHEQREMLPKMK